MKYTSKLLLSSMLFIICFLIQNVFSESLTNKVYYLQTMYICAPSRLLSELGVEFYMDGTKLQKHKNDIWGCNLMSLVNMDKFNQLIMSKDVFIEKVRAIKLKLNKENVRDSQISILIPDKWNGNIPVRYVNRKLGIKVKAKLIDINSKFVSLDICSQNTYDVNWATNNVDKSVAYRQGAFFARFSISVKDIHIPREKWCLVTGIGALQKPCGVMEQIFAFNILETETNHKEARAGIDK